MAGRTAIVVTGLPAGGKTTLGIRLAEQLGWPLLDKDAFLERLFEAEGIGDSAWRSSLSRRSDGLFRAAALALDRAVLVTHWRGAHSPDHTLAPSGTPTDWLHDAFAEVIEIHAACSARTAAHRFCTRTRHPGHLDANRTPDRVRAWMETLAPAYPLGKGRVITVDTEGVPDIDMVLGALAAG